MGEFRRSVDRVERQFYSFDSVLNVLPTLPIITEELQTLKDTVKRWRGEGRDVVPHCSMWQLASYGRGDWSELLNSAMAGGWFPLMLLDLEVEFRLVKVDAGRGLFGGQKVRYHWYMLNPDDFFVPSGMADWLSVALGKLGALYR